MKTRIVLAAVLAAVSALAQSAPNRYILFLDDDSVAARFSTREEMQTEEGTTYRRQIEAKQQALVAELQRRNFQVVGTVSTLLNAVSVAAPASRLPELRSLPGVKGIRPVRRIKPALNQATQLVNAPAAWAKLGGQSNAGAGMKIAIIDSGIDQAHPAFQDSSLKAPAGFPICTTGHPEDCAYTNSKVIVARSYVRQIGAGSNPLNPAADSQPDDFSPRDHDGHGSAVASAAAGNTNTGTVTFSGVAPKAFLGNYKVYGSPNVNDGQGPLGDDIFIMALDDAIKDGMDVANISSGGVAFTAALDTGAICGEPAGTPCDPFAYGVEAAAKAGMIVVVAAGNSGDGALNYPAPGTVSSPATAPSAIAVGATINSHVFQSTVSVLGANVPTSLIGMPAPYGDSYFGPSNEGANSAVLIDVTTLGDTGYACSALPTDSLLGAYALIARGPQASPCTFATKVSNAQAAGAVGVVLYSYSGVDPIQAEGTDQMFFGPLVMLSYPNGIAVKNYLAAHAGTVVQVDFAGLEEPLSTFTYSGAPTFLANQLASFSSIGPTPDGALKPDLVATGGFDVYQSDPNSYLPAPGGLYLATQHYDPNGGEFSVNGYTASQGTSFATPMVAGAAALVKQAHPTYTAAQVKSALVNSASVSATPTDTNDLAVDESAIGGGLLNVGNALSAAVTAEPSVVSFGYLKAGVLPLSKTLTITNKGTAAVTLSTGVQQNNAKSGTNLAATLATATLAPGATTTLTVALSGNVPAAGEYSGLVNVQGANVALTIPYMYIVGNGVAANFVPLLGPADSTSVGAPGTDAGSIAIQIFDAYGVPVVGASVPFAVAIRGSASLASVQGSPACTGSTTTVTCPTDSYGIAWVEVTLGTRSTAEVASTVLGQSLTYDWDVVPVPAITASGVVNDASFQQTISPGSYVAIFGTNLVDANNLVSSTGDLATLMTNGDLPLQIDFTSVSFDVPSAGISAPGYLSFAGPGQVNAFVPWELAGQSSAQVKVNVDEGIYGNVVTIPLSTYSPGFFEAPAGSAAALDANYKLISSSNPVARGGVAQLYVNGLGPVTNQPPSGSIASASPLSQTKATPTVTIGNQQAQVLFSGLAPGFTGLYQVNVVVPSGIAAGNAATTIAIGGVTSKTTGLVVK